MCVRCKYLFRCSPQTLQVLQQHVVADQQADTVGPRLYPTRAAAASLNEQKLNELSSAPITYVSRDKGQLSLLDSSILPYESIFKVGAQVIRLANLPDECLVNGSLGEVVSLNFQRRVCYCQV